MKVAKRFGNFTTVILSFLTFPGPERLDEEERGADKRFLTLQLLNHHGAQLPPVSQSNGGRPRRNEGRRQHGGKGGKGGQGRERELWIRNS